MKRFAFLVAVLVAGSLFAADREQFNIGKLYLNDTEVTATAAELNILDGVTVSAAQLNAAGAGSLATITPTTVSNANMLVYGSNITALGAVTIAEGAIKDSTIVSADIKNDEIVDADINASAAIAVSKLGTGGVIPANSAASLTNLPAAQLLGNVPVAALTNAADSLTGIGTKTFQYLTLTDLVYNDGATTGNVNIVSW